MSVFRNPYMGAPLRNGKRSYLGLEIHPMAKIKTRALKGRGMTLVEILIAISFLSVALLGLLLTITASLTLNQVNREETLALNAARNKVSEMQDAADFSTVYATYSVSPNNTFNIAGLDNASGSILFPQEGGVLKEDIGDPTLGMPRDLNGDTLVDGADRSGDYTVLPVRIRIQWTGIKGDRSIDFQALLTQLR